MMLHILSHGCDLDKNQSPAHVHLTLLNFSESQQNGEKRSVDVNFLFNVKVKKNAIFVEMLVAHRVKWSVSASVFMTDS